MMHLSLPVFVAPYQNCHNSSGLTFLLLPLYTVNGGVKTNVDSGEGMAINKRNYKGFGKNELFVAQLYVSLPLPTFRSVL